jgi:hypothetical protein
LQIFERKSVAYGEKYKGRILAQKGIPEIYNLQLKITKLILPALRLDEITLMVNNADTDRDKLS